MMLTLQALLALSQTLNAGFEIYAELKAGKITQEEADARWAVIRTNIVGADARWEASKSFSVTGYPNPDTT